MKQASGPDGLEMLVRSVQGAAQKSFANGDIYLERFLPRARHVEIQVFGFGDGRAIHLFERDCGLLPIAVWLPVRWIRLDAAKPLHAIACGFVSGGLNIGVGVAGPIVDIFFIRTEMDGRKVIATKALLQVLSHVAKIVFYAGSLWSLPSSSLVAIGLAAPFSVLGSIIGHHILVRMTDHGFRGGTRWLVTVVGAFYFNQGLYLLVT
jgi:uncharacterized membrane protein YfcA